MTAAQMKTRFLILYDKITNLAAPGYEDSEITELFNKAQLQFVKTRYNYKGNQYGEGFEETEKRRKDLAELVRNVNLTTLNQSADQNGVTPFGVFYDLPSEFLYTLREEITISSTDTCVNGDRILVKPITHDEYSINVKNPFSKPDATQAWRLDFSRDLSQGPTNDKQRHEVITDGTYTVTLYHVRYLKVPSDILISDDPNIPSVDCELNPTVHEELVDAAVRMAAGITDPQSYQIKIMEQKAAE
jgi:hypothetical protein